MQDLVLYNLKDADSAKFRNLTLSQYGGLYGEVNARAVLGGYVGFSRFVAFEGKVVILSSSANAENLAAFPDLYRLAGGLRVQ